MTSLRLQDFIGSILATLCGCGVFVGLRLLWKVLSECVGFMYSVIWKI